VNVIISRYHKEFFYYRTGLLHITPENNIEISIAHNEQGPEPSFYKQLYKGSM